MSSQDRIGYLQDQHDLFVAILIGGCLFFLVGGVLGVFASQDFANGTNFMMHLAGAEQGIGALVILVGIFKVRAINSELEGKKPSQSSHTSAARAGH